MDFFWVHAHAHGSVRARVARHPVVLEAWGVVSFLAQALRLFHARCAGVESCVVGAAVALCAVALVLPHGAFDGARHARVFSLLVAKVAGFAEFANVQD